MALRKLRTALEEKVKSRLQLISTLFPELNFGSAGNNTNNWQIGSHETIKVSVLQSKLSIKGRDNI